MNEPKPVNPKDLASILAKSKKVMHRTDENSKTKTVQRESEYDDEVMTETYDDYLTELPPNQAQKSQPLSDIKRDANGFPIYTNISKSKLPDQIKKIMLENPIPIDMANKLNPNGQRTFDLSDVPELIEKPTRNTNKQQPQRQITENVNRNNGDLITISKSELKDMIKSTLVEYLINDFKKTITEETIAKTINTLIKEGKIVTKKKI